MLKWVKKWNKCPWWVLNRHSFISWHQKSSFILSPTQKSFRWWKKELIQLIFYNYCTRKLLPHDTMPHLRVEKSEGTSGMSLRLSPILLVCFHPNFRAVTIETTSACPIGHLRARPGHVGGLGARQASENIPQFNGDEAVEGKGDTHLLCIHLFSVHNLRGRV